MTTNVLAETTTENTAQVEVRVRQVIQVVADLARRPLTELRILDLACLSGYFAVEFAARGAKVLGIEGRAVHVDAARSLAHDHGLSNVEFVQDDVRNLSKEKYGEFDVVLCLGILYHLDAPDVFEFVQRISQVCRDFAVIDTHFSLAGERSYAWRGQRYWGSHNEEHPADATTDEKLRALWDSLDNVQDFWLTRPSLCNLLRHVGFTSVYECHNPSNALYVGSEPKFWRDRFTLVACKGQPVTSVVWPELASVPEPELPEELEEHVFTPGADYKPGKREPEVNEMPAARLDLFALLVGIVRQVVPRAAWRALKCGLSVKLQCANCGARRVRRSRTWWWEGPLRPLTSRLPFRCEVCHWRGWTPPEHAAVRDRYVERRW